MTVLLKYGWEKVPNLECLFIYREKEFFLSVEVDDIKDVDWNTVKKGYSYLCMWTIQKLAGKTKYQPNVENTHERR